MLLPRSSSLQGEGCLSSPDHFYTVLTRCVSGVPWRIMPDKRSRRAGVLQQSKALRLSLLHPVKDANEKPDWLAFILMQSSTAQAVRHPNILPSRLCGTACEPSHINFKLQHIVAQDFVLCWGQWTPSRGVGCFRNQDGSRSVQCC